MGDEDDQKKFIKSHVRELCKSTVIGPEFVLSLYANQLIDDEEMQNLNNTNTSNITKAMLVYTQIANKWNMNQFSCFKKALEDTGNLMALQIFTNPGADCFLTNEQVQLLRQQKGLNENGCYEGLSYEDELGANKIVDLARGDEFFKDGIFKLSGNLHRKDTIHLVNSFEGNLKKKAIWWNPTKPKLSRNHIERRVAKTFLLQYDRTFHQYEETSTLEALLCGTSPDEALNKNRIWLLVDPPGMGKSTEVTHLEKQLRKIVTTNRLIVRVNLNEVQMALKTISEGESATEVLLKLSDFLPKETLQVPELSVFVLLDGLDEVCPKHEETMINLLRILKSTKRFMELQVVVTTRPHLRAVVEKKFSLQSWSIVPLTISEQNSYMVAEGLLTEQLGWIRYKLTHSMQELLSNPLMLSMLVGVLKSGGSLSETDININDLYTRFVDTKHELHLVEKQGMQGGANFTDLTLKSMLIRNLPFYYYIALTDNDLNTFQTISEDMWKSISLVAKSPSMETNGLIVTKELLSYGLLIEDSWNKLRFKHRSFAEFFYARLLLTENEYCPQILRDSLFGHLFGRRTGFLNNVQTFVEAFLSKIQERHNGTPLLSITTKWMPARNTVHVFKYVVIENFVNSKLYKVLAPEVIMTLTRGDPDELLQAFEILLHWDGVHRCEYALNKLVQWMTKNREWSREHLFKINECHVSKWIPPLVARLIVVIVITHPDQMLFSEEEVKVAVNSCDRLIYIVSMIPTYGREMRKWDFVDHHLEEGQLAELMKKIDKEDVAKIFRDTETAWKMVSTLSRKEIFSLITNKDTRVSDIIGMRPQSVSVTLGEEFASPRHFTEFRFKFGSLKGKTRFDSNPRGCDFPSGVYWEDLIKESEEKNLNGPVTLFLWEAILGPGSLQLLCNVEDNIRRRRNCPTSNHPAQSSTKTSCVMEWIVNGGQLFNRVSSLWLLPFIVRYSDNNQLMTEILEENTDYSDYIFEPVLTSFILASTTLNDESPSYISQLREFLHKKLSCLSPTLSSLTTKLIGAERQQIMETICLDHVLVLDVSVWQVFLGLPQISTMTVDKKTLLKIICEFIDRTPCCDLLNTFQKLPRIALEKTQLHEVLRSQEVFCRWRWRFSSQKKLEIEESNIICGLRHFVSFYMEVFGLNLEWMKSENEKGSGHLLRKLPLQIIRTIDGNPLWNHMLPEIQEVLRNSLSKENIESFEGVSEWFYLETEEEWEQLIQLIGKEEFLQIVTSSVSIGFQSISAAPLVRVLLRIFGVEWCKGINPLERISFFINHLHDSFESLASLFHSAIELGELEEVKRRAWPGLFTWRNKLEKNALDIAKESLEPQHPVRLFLEKLDKLTSIK